MKKELIVVIISFILLAGILILADLPLFNKISFVKGEIEKSENSIVEKKEVLAKVEQLKEAFNNREDAIKKVSYIFPEEKDSAGLIVQFEALASENNLILERIDFGRVTKDQEDLTVKNLEIDLNLKGNYLAFKSFLEALELNVRMMDVQAINFTAGKEENGILIFEFIVKLRVYYQ